MLVIVFVVMAVVAGSGANAQSVLAPSGGGGQVALVSDDSLHLRGHLRRVLG